jgi:hypothetical protein
MSEGMQKLAMFSTTPPVAVSPISDFLVFVVAGSESVSQALSQSLNEFSS